MNKEVFAFVFDPRIGKTFNLKRKESNLSFWIGGFRLKINRDTNGNLAMNEIFDTSDFLSKVEEGNQKVGDVLERRIDRTLTTTVSELIPPVGWDSIENVSLYPMRSDVMNQKSKTAISASRTDGMRHLFLEEGEVKIPKQVFTWYNPYRKLLYKKHFRQEQLMYCQILIWDCLSRPVIL